MKLIIYTALLIANVALFGQNFDMKAFEKNVKKAKDSNAVTTLFTDAVEANQDVEDLRILQDFWMDENATACNAYFRTMYENNKANEKWVYLYGRHQERTADQARFARRVITINEDYEYGYRLLAGAYYYGYFRSLPNSEYHKDMKKTFSDDERLFQIYYDKFPNEPFAMQTLLEFYLAKNQLDYANEYFVMMTNQFPNNFGTNDYIRYYLKLGKVQEAKKQINTIADQMVQSKRITEKDKVAYFDWFLTNSYMEAFMFEDARKVIMNDKSYARKTDKLILLASIESRDFNFDKAIEYLLKATELGYDSLYGLETNNDFTKLQAQKGWEKVVQKIKENRKASEPKRKKEALANKLSRPAPTWELKDRDGNLVSLEDYKGTIVILDFWATWCGPCKMAMPKLSEFTASKPENVNVFSVNVWENNPRKVKDFMKENDYKMELLFGNTVLAKKYGIQGIPYICVIDQDGIIRYEEKGFSESLSDHLKWWVDSLIK